MSHDPSASEAQQLALLVTSTTDYAIFMLDAEGYIRTWNAGAQRLKGYEPEEIVGKHFSAFYTQPDIDREHPANELRIAIANGSYSEEGWRVRKDGSTFWASVTITAIRKGGQLTGFAKVTRDLSERRQAEEELRRAVAQLAKANEELDRFASVAAHDMTDPLRTIAGFAELIERPDIDERDRIAYAGHIRQSSARLTSMLHRLLAYARAGSGNGPSEPIGLRPVADAVVADLGAAIADRDAVVAVNITEDVAVSVNRGDLRIVLQNLISNGIKFGAAERPHVTVAARREDGTWRVLVEDDGEGVGPDDLQRIFGAFERADSGNVRAGYGLGLAICKRLVEQYGGSIGVEPGRERGSRFWFTVPAA